VSIRMHQLELLSALPAYLYFTATGIALAIIDVEWLRLPNSIVLPSYPVVAALLAGSAAWQGDWWSLARAAVGAASLFAFYLTIALAYPAGMQFGDVKLSGIVGAVLAYLSWTTLLVGAFAAFVLGSVVGVALIATGRGGRKTALPLGPFMIVGALLAILVEMPVGRLVGL
jgi:leader peptidase (prepilin peptidase)/N-methyltransferase